MAIRRLLAAATALLAAAMAWAQLPQADVPQLKFINTGANVLHYDSASPAMRSLFDRWQRVAATGSGNISVVHIGSSHVQAGVLSNTIRTRIAAAYPSLVGPRGMVFPYSAAAKCNNPPDYRIHCREHMELTRNVYKDHTHPLGACGIAVTAADSTAEIQVVLADASVDYATSRIVVLGHSDQRVAPLVSIDGTAVEASYADPRTDRFVFNLHRAVDSFAVILPCTQGTSFTLTGIYLDNRRPGFTLSSLGVNGAALNDYLRCRHFVRDLRMLRPDVVVFGIGINDAAAADFDTALFRSAYLQLIDSVRAASPDCAFIFITNNDSYRRTGRRKYAVNTNGRLAREVFYSLADDVQGAVWDQFEVMGGLRSMDKWRLNGLAQTDRVHFTRAGYQLLGNLFSNALFQAVDNHKPSK